MSFGMCARSYALSGLINELVAGCQDLDGLAALLFSVLAWFIVHAGNYGREGWTNAVQPRFSFLELVKES